MTESNNEPIHTRKSRESESHAKTSRRQPWRPVRKLETPPAPEGYEYRWIRESMNILTQLQKQVDMLV